MNLNEDIYYYNFLNKQNLSTIMNNTNQYIYIDRLEFTNKSYPNIKGKVVKVVKNKDNNYDACFNFNFFDKRIWKINYNNCKIFISPKISSKFKSIKINGKNNKYITLEINNKKYNFLLDIGPSFKNKKDKSKQSICQMDSKYLKLFSGIETYKQNLDLSKIYLIKNIKFGKINLENIEFLEKINDPYESYWSKKLDIDNLIGSINGNLLSFFGEIILDFKNNKLYY